MASDTAICLGQTVTLNGKGASTYRWNNNAQNGVPIAPLSSIQYTVTGTDTNNCSNTASIIVYVFNLPNVSAHASAMSICNGSSVTLYGDSASTYVWSNSAQDRIAFTPPATNTYTVTGTDENGCSNTSSLTINVNPNPNPQIDTNGITTFCQGNNVVLSSSIAGTYLWSNFDTTQGVTISVSGNYSLTVTDANGCSGSSLPMAVRVDSLPTPVIDSNGPTSFCTGDSVILFSSISGTYLWSTSEVTRSIIVQTSGNYMLTVTNANECIGIANPVSVNINPLPAISAIASDTSICLGETVILNGEGASTYSWNNSAQNGVPIAPPSSVRYTVTGTDTNNCSNKASVIIYVFDLPNVSAHASAMSICNGSSVTLYGDSASTYTWSNSAQDGIAFTPPATNTYTVTGTDGNGCNNTSSLTINVNQNPNPQIDTNGATTFCQGSNVVLSSSIAGTYLWNNFDTTQRVTISVSGNYSLTVTDSNGCSGSSLPITVRVDSLPLPVIYSNGPTTFCNGDSVILFSSISGAYLWSTSEVTRSIIVDGPGNYMLTVIDAKGCVGMANPINIVVNPLPIVSLDTFNSVFNNTPSFQLGGGNPDGGSYSGEGVINGIFNPSSAGVGSHTITYTYVDGNGCADSVTRNILVLDYVGIGVIESGLSVVIYPNPNNGTFKVILKSEFGSNVGLSFMNSVGQIIYTQSYELKIGMLNQDFDLPISASGVYLLRLYIDGKFVFRKITITK